MLPLLLLASQDAAIFSDDAIQNWYGFRVLHYFLSLGSYKGAITNFANICYYGGLFDTVTAATITLFKTDVYATRHFYVALTGFGTIWFSAKFARLYGGYGAALATAWLLFLSPRFFGDSLNNPKDIPYALGMMMGLWCIHKLVTSGPKLSSRRAIHLGLAIGFAISMRIGGLLLIPYLGFALLLQWWFIWRKEYSFMPTAKKRFCNLHLLFNARNIALVAGLCIGGYLLGTLFWPWALQNPLVNPLKSLKLMTNAWLGATVLFQGHDYITWLVPWTYVPVYIAVSTPLPVIFSFLLLPVLFIGKCYRNHWLAFLLFVLIFPWLYVVVFQSPLYDGWRHFLFLYPLIVLVAVLSLQQVAFWLKRRLLKIALWFVVFTGMVPAVIWGIKYHPLQSIYYNELTGGLKGAYSNYETDVYGSALPMACEKLIEVADLKNRKDTITLATNFTVGPTYYTLRKYAAHIRMVPVFYQKRYDTAWDYAIFRSRGVDVYLLKNKAWPPKHLPQSVVVDGTMLYAIAERGKDTTDILLAKSLRQKDWSAAIVYAKHILQHDPKNETVHGRFAIALLASGRKDEALRQANVALSINAFDELGRAVYKAVTGKEYEVPILLPPPPNDMRWIFGQ